jgi:hypothetical protein
MGRASSGDVIAHVQPWTTLLGKSNNSFVQSEDQWLTLSGFRDLSVWVQVARVGPPIVAVKLETAPTYDGGMFTAQNPVATIVASAPGFYLAVSRANLTSTSFNEKVAVQQHLRWAVVPQQVGDFDITFRIVLCLNPVVPDFRLQRGDEVFDNPFLSGIVA